MAAFWDGVTRSATLKEAVAAVRHELCDAAKRYDFGHVLRILDRHPRLVNAWRPGGAGWFAPLHQAAHGGVSEDVVSELVRRGGWLTLPTASGARPVDLARSRSHTHLAEVLSPVLRRTVAADDMELLTAHLHRVIVGRVEQLVHDEELRLPVLEPLLEEEEPSMWFAVPGMYGGFKIELRADASPSLNVESWSRTVTGSGQRHAITPLGWEMVAEGFV